MSWKDNIQSVAMAGMMLTAPAPAPGAMSATIVGQYGNCDNQRTDKAALGAKRGIGNFALVHRGLALIYRVAATKLVAINGNLDEDRLLSARKQLELLLGELGIPTDGLSRSGGELAQNQF